MTRRGGISIQTIIVAALGILVLSVVAFLVIETMNETDSNISCTSRGGQCTTDDCTDEIEGEDLCQTGTCCVPLAVEDE